MLIAGAALGVLACVSASGEGRYNGVASGPVVLTTPTQAPPAEPELRGFAYPIAGGCLPRGDQLMPNALRAYRNGAHEGIDFYDVDNCTRITRGTEVVAAKAGRVIRADLGYADPTPTEMDALLANPNTDDALDKFRGRQVWIDHGAGVVTRYAHLNGIADGIRGGVGVSKGQLVGHVGESGTPESVRNPGREYHLHFELRVGDSHLGKDLPAAQVRSIYVALFSP